MRRRSLIAAVPLLAFAPAAALARELPESWDFHCDVAVLGAGGAGLAAAVSAAARGLRVIVFEKARAIGGDTLISGGFFNAAGANAKQDSPRDHAQEIVQAGQGKGDQEVAEAFTEHAFETLKWLQGLGMMFDDVPQQIFGSGRPRAYRPHRPRGTGYIQTLSEACLKSGAVIRLGCSAVQLYQDSETGRILGVQLLSDQGFFSVRTTRGIVLATGGFGANSEMVRRYAPAYSGLKHDSQPGAIGDGHRMAEQVGADLVNMPFIEVVPGGTGERASVVRLDYFPQQMVMVNARGERFVDEMSSRKSIADAILAQPNARAFTIVGSETVKQFDILEQKHLHQARFAGTVFREPDVGALAKKLGVPAGSLAQALVQSGKQIQPPFWAQRIEMHIHVTLGGVRINRKAQCLDKSGQVIPGLFAAGEVVGNLHGTVRLGGNGVSSAVVFGRIAGQTI